MKPLIRIGDGTSNAGIDQELSPTLASQLGNLAQTLTADPSKPRVIALVGSGRREGTTSCTVNLGRYLARRRARILMIDANIHDPGLHDLCGVERADGLQEILAGDRSVTHAVKPTSIPGLFVLTAGTTACDTVLTPAILRDRVLATARDYDFVLVDCAAVNLYEGSSSLGAACDGVILVIEGGRTLRQSARSAKQLLTRANCNILGVFINKRRFYIPQFLYDRL